jgi:hypothetical protein
MTVDEFAAMHVWKSPMTHWLRTATITTKTCRARTSGRTAIVTLKQMPSQLTGELRAQALTSERASLLFQFSKACRFTVPVYVTIPGGGAQGLSFTHEPGKQCPRRTRNGRPATVVRWKGHLKHLEVFDCIPLASTIRDNLNSSIYMPRETDVQCNLHCTRS